MMLCTGAATFATSAAPVVLPRAEQIELHSTRTGDDFRILVAQPETPPPVGGYPVVYVLDADLVFNSVVETMRIQARRPQATGVLPALIVGITYPEKDNAILRRAVDYTPTPLAAPAPEMSAAMRTAGGGADRFLDFIDHELRPLIAQRYATDASRQVLFGHSLGGLFVLHALFKRPQAFTHYVAASPSWWWNEAVMAEQESAFRKLPDAARSGRALLLTVGEFEQQPSRFSDNMPGGMATLTRRAMVDNVRAVATHLKPLAGLRVEALEIQGENHLSSLPQAINRGLRFALEP
ncbi:alpha/beta hydrolase-fold protein [Uliginosibacterium sp. H3]|uniref:Alpha/beta hydrolase-fold protein n=1 Tax=Uliginosibacterium silvisoli TaxID=3114758 RepID=A0ABU6K1B2_9RHOO|nr:alpha/beta hydrolase-fold protein [Uliginosibacterium sp. H3]